jgi:hypothetical protein
VFLSGTRCNRGTFELVGVSLAQDAIVYDLGTNLDSFFKAKICL